MSQLSVYQHYRLLGLSLFHFYYKGKGNLLRNGWWVNPDTGPTTVKTLNEKPLLYQLHQNYPNPFNQSTQIKFYLADPNYVNIEVYNTLGKRIKTLLNK